MPRSRLTALAIAIAAIIVCASCAAPAPLPLCPVAKIHRVDAKGARWYILDADNLEQLRQRLVGLDERTCAAGAFYAVDADAEESQ